MPTDPEPSVKRVAFERLYKNTYGFVRDRARALLREEEAARDAAQEAFVRAWEGWDTLRQANSQIGWLMVTATRLCLDRLRRQKVADAHVALSGTRSVAFHEPGHLARLLVTRLRREKRLRQQVVIHVWVDGMTQEEVARLLGVSRKTVQRQLDAFRASHADDLAALAEVRGD